MPVQDAMRRQPSATKSQVQVEGSPVLADVRVRCCARHDLRHGADPIKVAALLGVCVEDLDDILEADWP